MSSARNIPLVAFLLFLLFLPGCGSQQSVNAPDNGSNAGGASTESALPDWAPKEPSAEFLRAAKILKPKPQEIHPYPEMYRLCYEFFGTLTQDQLDEFFQVERIRLPAADFSDKLRKDLLERPGYEKEGNDIVIDNCAVHVPVRDFTPRQREIFDKMAGPWEAIFKRDDDPDNDDLLVRLYQLGAREDLSNVEVGFIARGGHSVGLHFIIEQIAPKQGVHTYGGPWFAQI